MNKYFEFLIFLLICCIAVVGSLRGYVYISLTGLTAAGILVIYDNWKECN